MNAAPVRRKGEHQMSCHNTINSEVLSDIKWVLKNPPKKLSSLVSNDFVNYLSLSLKDRRNNHPMVEEFIRQKIIPCDVHPMRRCFIMQIVITLASSIGSQHRSSEHYYALYYLLSFDSYCRKSLIQHCERSELRLHFEWTKVN